MLVIGDVELDDRRLLGQPLGDPLAQRQRPPEVGQDDGGALLLRDPRGGERDRGLGQHARDQDLLAVENAHQCPIPSPPSTGTRAPVMYAAASLARNRTTPATSSTSAYRPSGTCA